ncbi:MAG: hypothetical protein WC683_02250 [bacterium]
MADDPTIEQDETLAEQADEEETETGSPTPGGSIFEQFRPAQPEYRDGPDGMPIEKDPPWTFSQALPPPLCPQTFSCLEQEPDPKKGRLTRLGKCRFYKRQRVISPDIPDLALIERFCTVEALRGINGAAMCLKDSAIFDCEFRDPPDPAATNVLDAIDAEKIEIGKARVIVEGAGSGDREAPRKIKGYRMFKTKEDVEAGKKVLDKDEFQEVTDE